MTIPAAPNTPGSGNQRRILVIGIGNVLMRDDGLGVHVIERLKVLYHMPPNVRFVDGGTLGLSLLPLLDGITHLLLIDAVRGMGAPGDIVRLRDDEIPAYLATKVSVHEVGLQELLATAGFAGCLPDEIVLWGVEARDVELGDGLSSVVRDALDELVERVAGELKMWKAPLHNASPTAP